MKAVKTGMGAIAHDDGCSFRVWAPHAKAVAVRVSTEGKKAVVKKLAHEGNGYWAGDVAKVKPGTHYKFLLTLENGEVRERIDPYAMEVTNSVGDGVVIDHEAFDWRGDDFEMAPHNELVIYELHVGSFAPKGEGPGTLRDAQAQLSHLKKLGINAVQIMPVAEFAGDLSWGYNPAHIFAVESSYGGPEALKRFVRACHDHGMAVILDVVYNHFGPSDLDLWQFDGWNDNGGGGIYFYNDARGETPWGKTRPDYGRGEVRQFIRDNVMMWLMEYHIDGLRFDMTLYIRSIGGAGGDDLPAGWSLMQWVNEEVRQLPKRHITIAEDLRNVDAMTAEAAHDGAGFNSQWDANFVHPVRAAVIEVADEQRSMAAVKAAITQRYNDDGFRRVVYSESHDEVANGKARVPHEIDPGNATSWFSQKRSALAAALVFTVPGIPMIFQGQEFLQGEWFRDDVPLDWDLNEEFSGMVRLYRDLIRLRRNHGGVTAGLRGQFVTVHHVNDAMNVLAFQRWDQHGAGDDVVVVMNFANAMREGYEIGMPVAGIWKVRLNSDSHHYSRDFGNAALFDVEAKEKPWDGMPASATLTLPPYGFVILSQDKRD
ncbi:MAG TPA: alpha-amylase family glycosyl hydrolase [Aestuariivirga sp.]|nr:alpha-amylase family glycosyl hydrolase [Aestuariivirga sp.]